MDISGDDIEGQPYTIEELGALVVNKSGQLEVMFTMPGERRTSNCALNGDRPRRVSRPQIGNCG